MAYTLSGLPRLLQLESMYCWKSRVQIMQKRHACYLNLRPAKASSYWRHSITGQRSTMITDNFNNRRTFQLSPRFSSLNGNSQKRRSWQSNGRQVSPRDSTRPNWQQRYPLWFWPGWGLSDGPGCLPVHHDFIFRVNGPHALIGYPPFELLRPQNPLLSSPQLILPIAMPK